jgi:GT2 family glycosyltransferase
MTDVGIVIVTYNSAAEIGACLEAALASGAEVLVVDNASTDGTVAEVTRRGARLIANSVNRGFAAAVNQGFSALKQQCILLLNPDAILQTSLEPLRLACALPRAAGAGGFLLDRAGQPQTGFMVRQLPRPIDLILEALVLNRILPGNPVNRRYRAMGLDYREEQVVGQPAGAFLIVRRDVWNELGGFDESFHPLWFEDVDFCRRAADRGYYFYFEPKAVAKHTGAHSISLLNVELRRFYWYRNLLRYSARHFGYLAFRGVCLGVITGCLARAVAGSLAACNLQPMTSYRRVVRFACRCLIFGWRDEPALSGRSRP